MALSGKMAYSQTDGALTEALQTLSFSIDGTAVVVPNAVVVQNDEAVGSTKVVNVALNSNDTTVATLTAGQKLRYSIKKVKTLKLGRSATGAPSYTVKGVL
jgi:hypothetical protein